MRNPWAPGIAASCIFWGEQLYFHRNHPGQLVITLAGYLFVLGIGIALFSILQILLDAGRMDWLVGRKLDSQRKTGYNGVVRGGKTWRFGIPIGGRTVRRFRVRGVRRSRVTTTPEPVSDPLATPEQSS